MSHSLAARFAQVVANLGNVPLQIQLRAPVGPMMGTIVSVAGLPEGEYPLYEITAEAMMGNQKMAITMTFAGDDVLWFASAPRLADRPQIVTADSLRVGGRS